MAAVAIPDKLGNVFCTILTGCQPLLTSEYSLVDHGVGGGRGGVHINIASLSLSIRALKVSKSPALKIK